MYVQHPFSTARASKQACCVCEVVNDLILFIDSEVSLHVIADNCSLHCCLLSKSCMQSNVRDLLHIETNTKIKIMQMKYQVLGCLTSKLVDEYMFYVCSRA